MIFIYFQELILTSKESLSDNMDAVRKKFEVGYKMGKTRRKTINATWALFKESLSSRFATWSHSNQST